MEQLGLTMNEVEAYAYSTRAATPEQICVEEHVCRHSGSVEDVIPGQRLM